MIGKVKWFNNTKGFGFIELNGKDYFAHYKDIDIKESFKTIAEGSNVEFEPSSGERGLCAKNIRPIKHEPNAI